MPRDLAYIPTDEAAYEHIQALAAYLDEQPPYRRLNILADILRTVIRESSLTASVGTVRARPHALAFNVYATTD